MTTNKEWLFSLPLEEQIAWLNAEHVDSLSESESGQRAQESAPESDTREKLEADMREYFSHWMGGTSRTQAAIIGWLDRQAAITEEKTRYKWVTASAEEIAAWRSKAEKMKEQVYELTAERDKLQELNEYHALQYELASEDCDRLQAQVDKLTADLNKEIYERERYRSKFGKCIDYADAIHALMDDEGMA